MYARPMGRPITKDTVLCMSLAGRPSNVGTRFHNFLYAELAAAVAKLLAERRSCWSTPPRPSWTWSRCRP